MGMASSDNERAYYDLGNDGFDRCCGTPLTSGLVKNKKVGSTVISKEFSLKLWKAYDELMKNKGEYRDYF